jgi:hypothetical protein
MRKIKKIGLISLIFLGTFPIASVKASMTWEDDFSGDLDGWNLKGWNGTGGTPFYPWTTPIESGFRIENKILEGPVNTQAWDYQPRNSSLVIHDSNVAYGSWNLDLFIEQMNQTIDAEIGFMFTDTKYDYDWSNLLSSTVTSTTTGYLVQIGPFHTTSGNISLNLIKHSGSERSTIDSATAFKIDFNKFHHINITRNLDGKITVFFDSVLKLEADESGSTALTTSEQFIFFSWLGKYKLDTISVTSFSSSSESINGYMIWVIIPTLIIATIIYKKKK